MSVSFLVSQLSPKNSTLQTKGEIMRYMIVGLLLILVLGGCGSNSTPAKGEKIENPSSPSPADSSKQPPSIPNINQ